MACLTRSGGAREACERGVFTQVGRREVSARTHAKNRAISCIWHHCCPNSTLFKIGLSYRVTLKNRIHLSHSSTHVHLGHLGRICDVGWNGRWNCDRCVHPGGGGTRHCTTRDTIGDTGLYGTRNYAIYRTTRTQYYTIHSTIRYTVL
jgi:hypothetical protein